MFHFGVTLLPQISQIFADWVLKTIILRKSAQKSAKSAGKSVTYFYPQMKHPDNSCFFSSAFSKMEIADEKTIFSNHLKINKLCK
jgi:malate synthase